MISWRVATTFDGLTGSTLVHNRFSYSRSWSDVNGIMDSDGNLFPTTTNEGRERSSSELYAYTFAGNGFTQFSSYSSYETSSSVFGMYYVSGSFEVDEGETSSTEFSASFSGSYDIADDPNARTSESYSTEFFNVYNIETTTEVEGVISDFVLTSTNDPFGKEWKISQPFVTWTTKTFSNSATSTEIATDFDEHTVYWFLSYDTQTAMVKSTTSLEETATYAALATIVQADDSEVIYTKSDPGSVWNGFDAADGTSATRFTLTPRIITLAGFSDAGFTGDPLSFTVTYPITHGSGSNTSTTSSTFSLTAPANGGTFSNGSLTTAITRTVLSTYTSSTTQIISPVDCLPHVTSNHQITLTRTQTTSLSFGIFNSGASTYGGSVSTWIVTSLGYLPGNVTKYGPGYSFNDGISTSFTSSQIIESVPVFLSSSTSSGDDNGGFTLLTINAGNTSRGTYQVGVANNHTNYTSQFRWGTGGFVLGENKGGWLSCPVSLTVSTAIDGNGRHGTTLFNFSNSSATLSSNSYSRRITTGPDTATDTSVVTGLITIFGGTVRKDDSANALGMPFMAGHAYLHFGGGPFAPGWTVVEAAAPGAYTDLINGGTMSFRGDDTSRTGGAGSVAMSRYAPIPYYTPPTSGAGGPIYWVVPKNSTLLYPSERLAVNTFGIVDN